MGGRKVRCGMLALTGLSVHGSQKMASGTDLELVAFFICAPPLGQGISDHWNARREPTASELQTRQVKI